MSIFNSTFRTTRTFLAAAPRLQSSIRTFTARTGYTRPSNVVKSRLAGAKGTVSGALFGFYSSSTLGNALGTSESASVLREASPAASTKQPYALVFVSSSHLRVPRNEYVS